MSILLLTGAIDLRKYNVPFTSLVDLEIRLRQYMYSIEYAVDNYSTIDKIVFCENTCYDGDFSILSKKAESKGKEFEYLTFQGNYDQIQKRGKGYGEGEIIKHALENSQLLKTESSFYKLTGRLIVKNMDLILKTTYAGNAFTFKQKEISDRPANYFETYFYKVEIALYKQYLIKAYLFCNDNEYKHLEHVFYDKLSALPLRSFKSPPLVSGMLGSTGELYDSNFKKGLIEKFYFAAGIYNFKKTIAEMIFMKFFVQFLNFKRFIGIKHNGLWLFRTSAK